MKRTSHSGAVCVATLVLAAVMLAWSAPRAQVGSVDVGYGPSVPSSCLAGSPTLFILRGSTGFLNINACMNGKYQQIWQAERHADGETPASVLDDNENQVLSLAHLPNPQTSLLLTRNGVVLKQGVDYTVVRQQILLTPGVAAVADEASDTFQAWYRY